MTCTDLVRLADILLLEDDGISEAAYNQLYHLFRDNPDVLSIFTQYVEATDGRFYFESTCPGIEVILSTPAGDPIPWGEAVEGPKEGD